jgi:hypothetical protein
MRRKFGTELTRALGVFLRNVNLILFRQMALSVKGSSGNMLRYVFSNSYLFAVGKIKWQFRNVEEGSCRWSRGRGKGTWVKGRFENYFKL